MWKTQIVGMKLIDKLKSFASPNIINELQLPSSVVSHSNITQKSNKLPSLVFAAGGPICPGPKLADTLWWKEQKLPFFHYTADSAKWGRTSIQILRYTGRHWAPPVGTAGQKEPGGSGQRTVPDCPLNCPPHSRTAGKKAL